MCAHSALTKISQMTSSFIIWLILTAKEQVVFHVSEIQNPLCITAEESLSSPYAGFYLSFTVRKEHIFTCAVQKNTHDTH